MIEARVFSRRANLNCRGEVYDGKRPVLPQYFIEFAAIPDVTFLERSPLDKLCVTIGEVIVHDRRETFFE